MSEQVIKKADVFFKKKQFTSVVELLEPLVIDYIDSFYVFYMLGVSCLYNGDLGGAQDYLNRASKIKDDDHSLWLAQAALYLRKGDTEHAIESYLDVLEFDPKNKVAKQAMQFIRTRGDVANISQYVANGKIKSFYPDPGVYIPVLPIAAIVAVALVISLCIIIPSLPKRYSSERIDLNSYALSSREEKNAVKPGRATDRYVLTDEEATQFYHAALECFGKNRDNAVQVEYNRIMNSNASDKLKKNITDLLNYIEEPTFENLIDRYTYSQVAEDIYLYQNCWVVWSGRIANVYTDDYVYQCDFLVGYDTMKKIDGIVSLSIPQPVRIDEDRPLEVLAQIDIRDGIVYLNGKTVYQPLVEPTSNSDLAN